MVTENDVRTCMRAPKFEKLDEINCGLDDGVNTIGMNVKRINEGTAPPLDTTVQFLRGALDNIDSALTAATADAVPGFQDIRIEETMRMTGEAAKELDTARARGGISGRGILLLERIAREMKFAQRVAFNERVKALTNCLL